MPGESEPQLNPDPAPEGPPSLAAAEIGVPRERIAELRAYVWEFRQTRGAFVTAEKEKKQNPEAYEQAKTTYETKRAEYVGASVNRMLNERERITEAEVAANPRKVGMIEKQWRAWGEIALIPQSWREGFDHTAFGKTRVGQMFIRSLNMRTALSLSLWGVAVGSGFGSIVGIGSLVARSGVGAAGTYFGSQAFMEGLAQKLRFTLDRKKLDAAAAFDLRDTTEEGEKQMDKHYSFLANELARLEAAALLAGRKVGDTAEYRAVSKVYRRYAKTEQETIVKKTAEVSRSPEAGKRGAAARLKYITEYLDKKMLLKEGDYKWGARGRKAMAGLLAAMFPLTRLMALTMGEIAALEGRPGGSGHLDAVSEAVPPKVAPPVTEAARPPAAASGAPVGETVRVSPEAVGQVQGLGRAAQEAPVTLPAERTARLGADAAEKIRELGAVKAPGAEAIRSAVEIKSGPAVVAKALETFEKTIGPTATIQEGGSVWKSAMRLVETNQISKADFESAWRNSFVDIEGQGRVPIHKIGLVHAGDKLQLRFISAQGANPPRFEIMAESGIPLGSDQNLYAAYQQVGREPPEWLKESVGAQVRPDEAVEAVDAAEKVTGGKAAETPDTGGASAKPHVVSDEMETDALDSTPVHDAGAVLPEAEAVEGGAAPEAPQSGAHVAAEFETTAEQRESHILSDPKIKASVDYFHSSNLADQEAMIAALEKLRGAKTDVNEVIQYLLDDPAYIENGMKFYNLVGRLTDAASYLKMKEMTVGALLEEVPPERDLDAAALLGPVEIGKWRIAKLIRAASPDAWAYPMSIHTFLQTAPHYLMDLLVTPR